MDKFHLSQMNIGYSTDYYFFYVNWLVWDKYQSFKMVFMVFFGFINSSVTEKNLKYKCGQKSQNS